jgi:hypothetical protein
LNRPRYQHGFFSRHQRKKGPEVWVYRWRDIDAKGKPKMRALVIGSVKQYPTETAAWKAVSTLRLDVNHHTSRPEGLPETFEQLIEHYPTFRTSRTRFPGNFAGGLSALLTCLDSQYLSRELSHLANHSF